MLAQGKERRHLARVARDAQGRRRSENLRRRALCSGYAILLTRELVVRTGLGFFQASASRPRKAKRSGDKDRPEAQSWPILQDAEMAKALAAAIDGSEQTRRT